VPTPGLTAAEARQRLQRNGPNELPATARHGAWVQLPDVVREPTRSGSSPRDDPISSVRPAARPAIRLESSTERA